MAVFRRSINTSIGNDSSPKNIISETQFSHNFYSTNSNALENANKRLNNPSQQRIQIEGNISKSNLHKQVPISMNQQNLRIPQNFVEKTNIRSVSNIGPLPIQVNKKSNNFFDFLQK